MSRKKKNNDLTYYLRGLGDSWDWVTCATRKGDTVTIEGTESEGLTFTMMDQVSKEFGTVKINVSSETRNIGGCETCDYEYQVPIIHAYDVTRWPSPEL